MSDNKFIPVCEPLLAGNELEYVNEAVSTGWISSSGGYISKFEEAFAEYCSVKYAVGVCNGTVALHLALTALGIGKGDEVIIPSFTMIASAFAVCYTGAMPVFIDSRKDTWNIDHEKIEEKITPKTKAIMPVHVFGNMCSMDEIKKIAQKHNLYILEDAAEAHGAEFKGRKAGAFSEISAFSFFANKNMTTGEGGMVVTDNKDLYDQARYYRNICFPLDSPRVYSHDHIGFNYRMSNLHGALGLAQVEKADYYRDIRIRNHSFYRKYLKDCPGIIFQEDESDSLNVHWMNALVINPDEFGMTKDQLIDKLRDNQIDTRLLFTSMHRQKALSDYGCECGGEYPVTDWLTENGFYLPSGSGLRESEIKHICDVFCSIQKDRL